MIQELYCIETLARVDTLCLDKTGTITQGSMKVVLTDGLGISSDEEIQYILSRMYTALDDDNSTAQAIRAYAGKGDGTCVRTIPFSSARKASGVVFEGEKAYITGAYQFVCSQKATLVRIKNSRICQTRDAMFSVLARGSIIGKYLKGES